MKKNLLLVAALGLTGVMYAPSADAASTRSISEDYYWINGDLDEPMERGDRSTNAILLDDQIFDVYQSDNQLLYQDLTDCFFYAKPGQTLLPAIDYSGAWMHSYVFIDYDNDGDFYSDINGDGTPSDGSELVSYNAFNDNDSMPWVNSLGENPTDNGNVNVGELPEFTLPEDLKPGIYRMRYKVDWNSIDPAGNPDPGNYIANNGGVIVDVMLFVYTDEATVIDDIENGTVKAEDGSTLSTVPADEALTIVISGDLEGGLTIKSGYNVESEEVENKFGNPQYVTMNVAASAINNNTYKIPADMVRGNVSINGKVVGSSAIKSLESVNADGETVIYNLNGQKVNDTAAPGIYIVNGKKTVLK